MQDFNQATNYEFRDRGQVYNLYLEEVNWEWSLPKPN